VDAGGRPRPVQRTAVDDARRRDDVIDQGVVAGQGDCPGGPYLDLVHGGDGDRVRPDQPGGRAERELKIGEAAALAQPRAVLADRDAAHHHQVDRGKLVEPDPPGGAGRPADRGRLAGRLIQVIGIQGEERLRLGEPRDRHVHGLAVFERPLAHRQLRGIGVGLEGRRGLPRLQGAQPLGCRLGASEVRDAAGRAGEARHSRLPHGRPHVLAQGGLRRQHVGRAAGVTVMSWRGTGHCPILPACPGWRAQSASGD